MGVWKWDPGDYLILGALVKLQGKAGFTRAPVVLRKKGTSELYSLGRRGPVSLVGWDLRGSLLLDRELPAREGVELWLFRHWAPAQWMWDLARATDPAASRERHVEPAFYVESWVIEQKRGVDLRTRLGSDRIRQARILLSPGTTDLTWAVFEVETARYLLEQ